MKKVYFVLPTLDCGGADRVLVTIAKHIKSRGFNVKVINIGKNEGELFESINSNLNLVSLGHKKVSHSFYNIYKLLKKEKPDYIFSSRVHVSILMLTYSYIFPKIKMIIREPTMLSNKLYSLKMALILSLTANILYKRAYKIIAQTEEMRDEIIEQYRVNREDVIPITNPVDTELISSKLISSYNPFKLINSINYVAVGNVKYVKGYDILIEAFKRLIEELPNAHLYILGNHEGQYAKDLADFVKRNMMENNVHLLGFKHNPYIYMKYCNAYVLSSRMEGLPNVLLEALYLNKPVVTTKCIPFIQKVVIDGKNGYTVEKDNVEDMYHALRDVLSINNIENRQINELEKFEIILR